MEGNKPVHTTVRTVNVYISEFYPEAAYDSCAPVYDLQREGRLIRRLFADAFPKATTISFRQQIVWRWNENEPRWRPVVVAKDFVKNKLIEMSKKNSASAVKDVAQCLEDLFDEGELTPDLKRLLRLEDDLDET